MICARRAAHGAASTGRHLRSLKPTLFFGLDVGGITAQKFSVLRIDVDSAPSAFQFFCWRKWRRQDVDSGSGMRAVAIAIAAQLGSCAVDQSWGEIILCVRNLRFP